MRTKAAKEIWWSVINMSESSTSAEKVTIQKKRDRYHTCTKRQKENWQNYYERQKLLLSYIYKLL